MYKTRVMVLILGTAMSVASTGRALAYDFSTGNPDGRIATASRPSSAGQIEIESADDFILSAPISISSATFTGLLTGQPNISDVSVEIYRVFPADSQDPPSGRVPTRTNSPSDFAVDTRSLGAGNLSLSTTSLGQFTALNSVLDGIHPIPSQTTGGEGSMTGEETLFTVNFGTPFRLPADHYFFVPQVDVGNGGEFYWLSAPKPIVPPGDPFAPDLQSWIRNEDLAPDWLRIGTDIVGPLPDGIPTYNAVFSIHGEATPVPEPTPLAMVLGGLFAIGLGALAKRRGAAPPIC